MDILVVVVVVVVVFTWALPNFDQKTSKYSFTINVLMYDKDSSLYIGIGFVIRRNAK